MHYRSAAIFAILCFALSGGGCASKSNKDYDEVVMPLQTGSVLHRRAFIERERESKKKPKKKSAAPSKPEAEPAETPPAEEESTPPPDRFR
jgi:hypothetical protein